MPKQANEAGPQPLASLFEVSQPVSMKWLRAHIRKNQRLEMVFLNPVVGDFQRIRKSALLAKLTFDPEREVIKIEIFTPGEEVAAKKKRAKR